MSLNSKAYLQHQENIANGIEPPTGYGHKADNSKLKDYWQSLEEANKIEENWSEEDKKRAYDSLNNRNLGND
jgi:hypothetical protein